MSELKLELHPDKIFIKTIASGVDFLGLINFTDYLVLLTNIWRRMFKKIRRRFNELKNNMISEGLFKQSLQSYLGILKHCNAHKIENQMIETVG